MATYERMCRLSYGELRRPRDEAPPPVPPSPGPGSVFCDVCWCWRPAALADCPYCAPEGR